MVDYFNSILNKMFRPVVTTLISFAAGSGKTPLPGFVVDSNGDIFAAFADGVGPTNLPGVFEIANMGSAAAPAYALTPTVLGTFNLNGSNGSAPARLTLDANGNLFGVTPNGGAYGYGTIIEYRNSGTAAAPRYTTGMTTLASFNKSNGWQPTAGVQVDGAGNLIGAAPFGGASNGGVIYMLKNTGTAGQPAYGSQPVVIYSFPVGSGPYSPSADVTFDGAGNILATARGYVIEFQNTGTLTAPVYAAAPKVLASYSSSDNSTLSLDANGNIFGMTTSGGAYYGGMLFEIKNLGTASAPVYDSAAATLVSFNTPAYSPYGRVIVDAAGDLFGLVASGTSAGSVFVVPNVGSVAAPKYAAGGLTIVAQLPGANGVGYAGLQVGKNGMLYAVTKSGGANGAGSLVAIDNSGYVSTLPGATPPPTTGASAPIIGGMAAGQTTTYDTPITPFAATVVSDFNANAIDTVTFTVVGSGVLADGAGFSGLQALGGGSYRLSGTAAQVTSEIKALRFTPLGTPGAVLTDTINISLTSSAYASPVLDSTTTIVDFNPAVSVATWLGGQSRYDALANGVAVADSAANVAAALAALSADAHVVTIQLTDSAPVLALTVAQATGASSALARIATAHTTAIVDTAANIGALSASQASAFLAQGFAIKVNDSAANLQALTPAQIAALAKPGVSSVATNAYALNLTCAQAIAFEGAGLSVSCAAGSPRLSDVSANVANLTAAQIAALPGMGVKQIYVSDAAISYTAAQTAAILSAGVAVSAASGVAVTENFPNGGYSVFVNGVLTAKKTVNADLSFDIATYGVTGQPYTSTDAFYSPAGKLVSQTWSNGASLYQSETWNADGSVHDIRLYKAGSIAGVAYASVDSVYAGAFVNLQTFYNSAGSVFASETFASNGGYAIYVGATQTAATLTTQKTVFADGAYTVLSSHLLGSYSSYTTMYNYTGYFLGSAYDLVSGAGMLTLGASGVTVKVGAGSLSLQWGADTFALSPHTLETINAAGTTGDTFVFAPGFGQDTLNGFVASGAGHDFVQFNASAFGAADAASAWTALLNGAKLNAAGWETITDSLGDTLTLTGIDKATLIASQTDFKFV